jgi:hypothetical protein
MNVTLAVHQRLQNAVHSVHDAAIAREDDGICEINLFDKASVLHNPPARHPLGSRFLDNATRRLTSQAKNPAALGLKWYCLRMSLAFK